MQNVPNRPVGQAEKKRAELGISNALTQATYQHWAPAIVWDGPAPAVYNSPTSSMPGHWLMQDRDGTSLVYYTLNVPEHWIRGHVEPVIHYMVDDGEGGGSGGNIVFQFGWSFQQRKTVVPVLTTKTATVAIPASGNGKWLVSRPTITIDSVLAPAFTTAEINPKPEGAYVTTVPPKHDALYFQIGRLGGGVHDDSTEDLRLFGVQFLFFEHAASVGRGLLERGLPEDHR